MEVNDAIVIAAGIGSRMLPASLYAPKEFLPMVDIPAIHHLIWEAAKSGVGRIHLVTSEEKIDFAEKLAVRGKTLISEGVRADLSDAIMDPFPEDVEFLIHLQKSQKGVGDAILCALGDIDGPCLVLLGDNLLMPKEACDLSKSASEASCASLEMVQRYESEGAPLAGIYPVPEGGIPNYGVVELSGGRVVNIVEKPEIALAPSNMALCGRYVLPPGLKEVLNMESISRMGELQSIGMLMHYSRECGLVGHSLEEYKWYDSGNPVEWLRAQIDHALSRPDLRDQISSWLDLI